MPAVVRVVDLVKDYFLGAVTVHALCRLNLGVENGEFVALMGPSGSGKSTLLNVLGCLDRPTAGSYFLGEQDVAGMDDDQLSDIRSKYLGFIFQSYNLLPQYTVVENIEVPLLYQGTRLNAQTKQRCVDLAAMVGLGDRLDHRPMQLSGGQQQRVAIARALVNEPSILLADEPTGALDTKTGKEILDLFEQLHRERGITVIVVTHDMNVARRADRIVSLRDGHIESDVSSSRAVPTPAASAPAASAAETRAPSMERPL